MAKKYDIYKMAIGLVSLFTMTIILKIVNIQSFHGFDWSPWLDLVLAYGGCAIFVMLDTLFYEIQLDMMSPQQRQISLGIALTLSYFVGAVIPFVMILESPGPEYVLGAMGLSCLICLIYLRLVNIKKKQIHNKILLQLGSRL